MTWKEIKDASLQLMFSYSRNGITRSAAKNKDYIDAMVFPANIALKTIAQACPIRQSVSIKQYLETDTTTDVDDDEDVIITSDDARSFYAEIQGDATVYYERLEAESYIVVHSETVSNRTFQPVRYLYSVRCEARVRIVNNISDSDFRVQNYAFYAKYFSEAEIPSPGENRVYSLSQIIEAQETLPFFKMAEKPIRLNERDYSQYVLWDGKDTLTIPGNVYGEFFVHYYAYPTAVAFDTSDSHEIELEPEAVELIPYFIASVVYAEDDPQQAAIYHNKYMEMLAMLPGKGETFKPDSFESESGWI